MDMQCPHCGYKFFYFEFYPYPVKGDTMIMNTDDDEGA
jgi:hypothetical protein